MLTTLLAFASKRNSRVAIAAAALILGLFCITGAGTRSLLKQYRNPSTSYRNVRTDLPFVTASGLTFVEMDHRESPEFIHRLYYLTDHESAVRYHTTIFEDFPVARQWLPIRANVTAFRDFTMLNHRFLVLATAGFPEDWLLQKLQDDGAQIRLLQNQQTGYRDRELYEVTLREEQFR